jgi:excisionase family DNA binding protein
MKKNIFLIHLLIISEVIFCQTILIRNPNKQPIKDASVSIQVKYNSSEFLLEKSKELFFTFITDTLGRVVVKGEFQKDNFQVESVTIKVQHKDFANYDVVTKDYSSQPSFTYTIYLVPKNNSIDLTGKLMTNELEVNELDVYSSQEIAEKLKVKEEDIISLIDKGKLRGKKIGDKYFVSGNDLRKYLEE